VQHACVVLPGVSTTITHWSLACPKEDKLLVLMTVLKLGLVRRKVLVFVNSIDQASCACQWHDANLSAHLSGIYQIAEEELHSGFQLYL
jgi:superfamily II DNA/RNA helicase